MNLKITLEKNMFFVEGIINKSTAPLFESHMDFLFHTHQYITLNIERVKEIDQKGMGLLSKFYKVAQRKSKQFYITGNGCKEIYDEFML